jgi:hypothetical protein
MYLATLDWLFTGGDATSPGDTVNASWPLSM